jgi:hypothetical protein
VEGGAGARAVAREDADLLTCLKGQAEGEGPRLLDGAVRLTVGVLTGVGGAGGRGEGEGEGEGGAEREEAVWLMSKKKM